MLIQFDRFLHDRVFNPLSLRMQRRFRVNRYHLLVIFGVVNVLMNIAFMFVGSMIEYSTEGSLIAGFTAIASFVAIAIWVTGGSATRHWAALAEAADRFEERGFITQPTMLIQHAMVYGAIRPHLNLVLMSLPLLTADWTLGWLVVLLGGQAHQMTVIGLGRAVYAVCFVYEIHLWHVQDLDPRDREYYRQLQKSTS